MQEELSAGGVLRAARAGWAPATARLTENGRNHGDFHPFLAAAAAYPPAQASRPTNGKALPPALRMWALRACVRARARPAHPRERIGARKMPFNRGKRCTIQWHFLASELLCLQLEAA